MIDALNVIYGLREKRGFIELNLVSLAFTLGAITVFILAIGAVIVFPLLFAFDFGNLGKSFLPLLRWPALLIVLMLGLAMLYRFGPSPHGAKLRWLSPGAAFAAFGWMVGSLLLSWYLANFADYDAAYGSLGAVIGLMMWMWMSSIVVLMGAQINDVLDNSNGPARTF